MLLNEWNTCNCKQLGQGGKKKKVMYILFLDLSFSAQNFVRNIALIKSKLYDKKIRLNMQVVQM